MAEATIPVDLFNPGQVFACLGFVEAAEVLMGPARGRFFWEGDESAFTVSVAGPENPVERVLDFLSVAQPEKVLPLQGQAFPCNPMKNGKARNPAEFAISLRTENQSLEVTSWLDLPGLEEFKLFAGQQNAETIYRKLLDGEGKSGVSGYRKIFSEVSEEMGSDPLNSVAPMASRFGYDARGGQDALRAGFSLDEQNYPTACSHVVELLAPVGLNHARPERLDAYRIRYSVVDDALPASLLRVSLSGANPTRARLRSFTTHLGDDKYYKKVFFAL